MQVPLRFYRDALPGGQGRARHRRDPLPDGRIPQALRGGWAARARVIGAGALTLVLCASALGTTVKTRQWTVYSFQVFLHTEWISAEEMEQMVGEDATVFDGAVVFGVPDSGVSYVGVLTQGQSFYRQRSRPVGKYGIYLVPAPLRRIL